MTFAYQNQHVYHREPIKYSLSIRQQPCRARLCSFKDKVDRRPLDPPPIIQIFQNGSPDFYDYKNSSNYFLQATLTNASDESDIHTTNRCRTTAGAVVQSLHKLKDTNNEEGAFFIFSDINIRIEGTFKLKFTLFQIVGLEVKCVCSILSNPFTVYPSKFFPGMSESTLLTRLFSDQGVRIRIRKETRSINSSRKRRRGMDYEDKLKSEYHHHHPYQHSPTTPPMDHHGRNKNVMSMENLLAKETMPRFPLKPFETMLPAPHQLLPLMFSNKQDDVLRLPSLRENRITANHLFADELRL